MSSKLNEPPTTALKQFLVLRTVSEGRELRGAECQVPSYGNQTSRIVTNRIRVPVAEGHDPRLAGFEFRVSIFPSQTRGLLEALNGSMAPIPPAPQAGDDSHQQLLDQLDLTLMPRPFRNPHWKPSQRRNKNIKQIIGEASRKEASVLVTQNNSGSSTPHPQSSANATGSVTPLPGSAQVQTNITQAAQNLSTMVLERNLQASLSSGPIATYTNIESAPSLHPAHQKHYCDITGLPAPYTDPKSRLRYHNAEVFQVVRSLPQSAAEKYLEARGAHVVLK